METQSCLKAADASTLLGVSSICLSKPAFRFQTFFFFLMYKINGSYRLLFTVIRQNSAWHSGLSLAKLARMLPSSCDLPNTMGMHPALLGSAPHSDLGSPQITASQIKHTVIIRCS